MRILLVEDDHHLGDSIRQALLQQQYTVEWVNEGNMAEMVIRQDHFDAVIMDVGLPQKSGIDVINAIRNIGIHTPIIILTARDSTEDRIRGLDAGADDYLTKPFAIDELSARLRALMRRSTGRTNPLIKHGEIIMDPAAHIISLKGQSLSLPRREFSLMEMLLNNVGKVVSRTQIVESLYTWDEEIDSNALEVHVHQLRKKFGSKFIRTVRGVGYMVPSDH